jgi:hypothetical protein
MIFKVILLVNLVTDLLVLYLFVRLLFDLNQRNLLYFFAAHYALLIPLLLVAALADAHVRAGHKY